MEDAEIRLFVLQILISFIDRHGNKHKFQTIRYAGFRGGGGGGGGGVEEGMEALGAAGPHPRGCFGAHGAFVSRGNLPLNPNGCRTTVEERRLLSCLARGLLGSLTLDLSWKEKARLAGQ